MTGCSFTNAVGRFLAIRGPVKLIHSERVSNFYWFCRLNQKLRISEIAWVFNVPHASHISLDEIWERMIGMTKKTPCYLNQDPNPSNIKLLLPFNQKCNCNKYFSNIMHMISPSMLLKEKWISFPLFSIPSISIFQTYIEYVQSSADQVSFGVIGGGNIGTSEHLPCSK